MANFISIRGWLEGEDLAAIKDVITSTLQEHERLGITKETLELYSQGWQFNHTRFNWTEYIFYGGDVKDYHSDFFFYQLQQCISLGLRLNGFFCLTPQEGDSQIISINEDEIRYKDITSLQMI